MEGVEETPNDCVGQYTQETGTHCGVVCTRSIARSKLEIVSSISLFTIVKSKK